MYMYVCSTCTCRTTMTVGSVAALYNIRPAISVAHAVMKHSTHTLLVGRDGTDFQQEAEQYEWLFTRGVQ